MAIAPHLVRAQLIAGALREASMAVSEPIDRIEVHSRTVVVSARRKRVTMTYTYGNFCDANGVPMLGGGSWSLGAPQVEDAPLTPRWIARLLGRRPKST